MNKPEDYKCIAIWGHMMGSYPYYIKDQQYRAASSNAPLTAIFERDSVWATAEEVTNEDARSRLMQGLARLAR